MTPEFRRDVELGMELTEPVFSSRPGTASGYALPVSAGNRLRLLSYNIQTGLSTRRYSDYLTRGWKHFVPTPDRLRNLNQIANCLHHYDVVGLQEVDAGSLRTGYMNQTEYLAEKADFEHWHCQTNRNFGRIARHSIGMLSRIRTHDARGHRLPGLIPGRGAVAMQLGEGDDAVLVVTAHLALSQRARLQQFSYISDMVSDYRHAIVMGDFNCQINSPEMRALTELSDLRPPAQTLHTFPSWQPLRSLDHILVTPTLEIEDVSVLPLPYSDHLPVSMVVRLPESVVIN